MAVIAIGENVLFDTGTNTPYLFDNFLSLLNHLIDGVEHAGDFALFFKWRYGYMEIL